MWLVVLGVHIDVHGEVGYVVGGCNVQCTCYTEHGRYGLSCLYAETEVHEQCWLCTVCMVCMVCGLYGMMEFKLCCEILLLLNI